MWLFLTMVLLATPPVTATLSTGSQVIPTQDIANSNLFPVTPDLEPRVRFWEFIFGQLPSSHFLLHDIHYPELTYSTAVFDVVADEKPNDTVKRLRSFLEQQQQEMATILHEYGDGNSDVLSRLSDPCDQERIADLFKKYPEKMANAWQRVHIQRGVADSFALAVERCENYREDIQLILREQHVPEELYWLVFVESMCNPNIRSYAGAAGIWQLMPDTARDFNLVVNKQQDDRLDIKKATRASAKLFKRGQRMLGEWPLIMTGYNHGPTGVLRLTQEYKTTDLAYLIENVRKSSFGFASKNFYAEFIAVQRVGKSQLAEKEVQNEQGSSEQKQKN